MDKENENKKAVKHEVPMSAREISEVFLNPVSGLYDRGWGLTFLRKGVEDGDPLCMVRLADVLLSEEHTEEERKEALAALEKAIKKNYAPAYTMLGNLYLAGKEVKKDIPLALSYYESAARRKNLTALISLAEIYSKGEDTPKDITKAESYYRKACKLCDPSIVFVLAVPFVKLLVSHPKEDKKAIKEAEEILLPLVRKDKKNGEVAYLLGEVFTREDNKARAKIYFAKAKSLGVTEL